MHRALPVRSLSYPALLITQHTLTHTQTLCYQVDTINFSMKKLKLSDLV